MPRFLCKERKHKVRLRLENDGMRRAVGQDSNVLELLPTSVVKNEVEKRSKTAPKQSDEKKKRLEKYIDRKLQKEANLDLIKRLANSKVDTSLFQSSKSIGLAYPKNEPRSDTSGPSEPKSPFAVSSKFSSTSHTDKESSGSSLCDDSDEKTLCKFAKTDNSNLGSGLKRPLETDIDGKPILEKRKRLRRLCFVTQKQDESAWEDLNTEAGLQRLAQRSSSPDSLNGMQAASDTERPRGTDSIGDHSSKVSVNKESPRKEDHNDHSERTSSSKIWAYHQVNEALGCMPHATPMEQVMPETEASVKYERISRAPETETLPHEVSIIRGLHERKTFSVPVNRSLEVLTARAHLPIVPEEQRIMEAIYNNPVVIIRGAAGSGKTTQVPQFLYEAGFGSSGSPNPGMIGITQPRRVATVTISKRVGAELGDAGKRVSYQIRFDSSVSETTAIKFMTDGVLMREIAGDFALLKYSAIVIDEAHERSANTDILVGILSRVVDLRASLSRDNPKVTPLKLIIMSATLRIEDLVDNANLFRRGKPRVVNVEGRQYPVTIHFSKNTKRDYVEEAFWKVCKGHRQLPPGGILVFLTGQNEIKVLEHRLRGALPNAEELDVSDSRVRAGAAEAPLGVEDIDLCNKASQHSFQEEDLRVDQIEGDEFVMESFSPASSKARILPLYAHLQTKEQLKVFELPPNDTRLIVLATNIAETSLTIPGIRYVIDTGRSKEKQYNHSSGVQSFDVGWISKASASQRAGRAGRTGAGHCYRLYSSAVYERDFEEYPQPEILRLPVEGIVLQLKSMGLNNVINFPFPTPPNQVSLAKAEKLLSYIGATSPDGKITEVGRRLSDYPLSPRFSKMLSIGSQHKCMPYTIALVAALATPNLLIEEHPSTFGDTYQMPIYEEKEHQSENAHEKPTKEFNKALYQLNRFSGNSDALKAVAALCAYQHATSKKDFCAQMLLSPKSLSEASNLQAQLSAIVSDISPYILPRNLSFTLPYPTKLQMSALQQITAAAFIDQIAIINSAHPSPLELSRKPTQVVDVPYLPLFPVSQHPHANADIADIAVFIHPSSVLARLSVKDLPTFVIYSHLQRSVSSTVEGNKRSRTRMHALTTVTGKQIAGLAKGTPLLSYGKPVGKIETIRSGNERTCWVVPTLVGEMGRIGWPLPALKISQIRGPTGEWEMERIIS